MVKREQERELQRILQQAKLDKKQMSKGSEWGLSSSHAVASNAINTNFSNSNNGEANNFSKSHSTHNLNSHHTQAYQHNKKWVSLDLINRIYALDIKNYLI